MLVNRKYNKRTVVIKYFDEEKFKNKEYYVDEE